MKMLYVRNTQSVMVKHGLVTSVGKTVGTVLFDGGSGSAYFRIVDGCCVGLGEKPAPDQAIKFTVTADIVVPNPKGENEVRRIVAVLNNNNPDWVYIWAYEDEYRKISNQLAELELKAKTEANQREQERLQHEEDRRHCQQLFESFGMFRLVRSHFFFRGETKPRQAKPFVGPMALSLLLTDFAGEKIKPILREPEILNDNDRVEEWIERQVVGEWIRVEISDEEISDLYLMMIGVNDVDSCPVINRLSSVGVPVRQVPTVTTKAPQSGLDRRQRERKIAPVVEMTVSPEQQVGSLEEMISAAKATA